MLLDIVILPPPLLRRRLGLSIKKATKGLGVRYISDNKKLIPHLSLFHINIRTSVNKINKLAQSVEQSLVGYRPVEIKSLSVGVIDNAVYYWLSNNTKLIKLNKKMVASCASFRDGTMPWLPKRQPTSLERRHRKLFGVHYNIGKTFVPHFTMVRMYKDSDANKVVNRIGLKSFKFKANIIALCQVTRRHQVKKVLKEFKV